MTSGLDQLEFPLAIQALALRGEQSSSPDEEDCSQKIFIIFSGALLILIGIFALCDINLLNFLSSISDAGSASFIVTGALLIFLYYLKSWQPRPIRELLKNETQTINGQALLKELNDFINLNIRGYLQATTRQASDIERINVFLKTDVDGRICFENNLHSYNKQYPYHQDSPFLTKDVFSNGKNVNLHLLIIIEKHNSKNADLIKLSINDDGLFEQDAEKIATSKIDSRLKEIGQKPEYSGCFDGVCYAKGQHQPTAGGMNLDDPFA